jgi:hypothetical protein
MTVTTPTPPGPATPPRTADPASPWVSIQELNKNVVTLAAALIGVTVTFAAQLLGKADLGTRVALYIAWGAAVLSIGFGALAHALLVNYLKTGRRGHGVVFFSNFAFFTLVLAAAAFSVFGYFALQHRSPLGAASIVESAIGSAPVLVSDKGSKWLLKSLVYDPGRNAFDMVLVRESSSDTLEMTMNSSGEIIKVQKQ